MHPAFATLEFGPFASEYHRRSVNDAFKERLSAYLELELLPQLELPFDSTAGRLRALYDDEKYCGEISAVRNIYKFEFAFRHPSGDDTITADLSFNPTTESFAPRHRHQELCLSTARHRESYEAIQKLWRRVVKGERLEGRCPQCAGPLSITNAPSLVGLTCRNGCFDFDAHRDARSGEFAHGHAFFRPKRVR